MCKDLCKYINEIAAEDCFKHANLRMCHARLKANARVAENLSRKATSDGCEAVTAGIFWMKTRTRWKEVSVHQHAGVPDRTIIEIRPIILTPLTEADRSMQIESSALPGYANAPYEPD